MTGRKSERSRKSVNYSKHSADESEDDDFADPTPPRKKKTRKLDKSKEEDPTDKANTVKPERKSRNRLSEEERYQQELEAVLKMSLTTTKTSLEESQKSKDDETANPESQSTADFATPPQSLDSIPSQSMCTVQADVLPSPNTKLLMDSKTKSNIERRKQVIINEAASQEDDFIISDPIKECNETGRRKSDRRRKIIKEKEEDEYKMSDESDSDEEISSPDESSDESDYEETPKKKMKPKKQTVASSKKAKSSEKCSSVKVATPKSSTQNRVGKENKPSSAKPTTSSVIKPQSSKKVETAKISANNSPRTPKTSTNFLTKRSPAALLTGRSPVILNKPGKFIQPGWTPPGLAGSKPNILKSPNVIRRVGLSRNVRLTPLHPKVGIK